MAVRQGLAASGDRYGNLQKHTSPNRLQAALIRRFHNRIGRLIRETGVTAVFDAGCGEGFLLDHLNSNGQTVDYMGADLSLEAIRWSRSNLNPGFRASVADIHRIPHPDNAFALVVCLEVLEHIPDSSAGLRELARISSRYVMASVPHEPYFRAANFLRGKHLSRWGNDPEHIHNYSGRAFRRLMASRLDLVWHGYSFPWQIALARKRV
jgi:2-polyprenyl-3-methyl-5-hydroxy-6-metoxy-1,4-benzoquinol methylase